MMDTVVLRAGNDEGKESVARSNVGMRQRYSQRAQRSNDDQDLDGHAQQKGERDDERKPYELPEPVMPGTRSDGDNASAMVQRMHGPEEGASVKENVNAILFEVVEEKIDQHRGEEPPTVGAKGHDATAHGIHQRDRGGFAIGNHGQTHEQAQGDHLVVVADVASRQ